MRSLVSSILAALSLTAGPALAWADSPKRSIFVRANPKVPAAGQAELISIPGAAAYAQAHRNFERGASRAALKALEGVADTHLEDRIALLRGRAWFALGRQDRAEDALRRAIQHAMMPTIQWQAGRELARIMAAQGRHAEERALWETLRPVVPARRRLFLYLSEAKALARLGRPTLAAKRLEAAEDIARGQRQHDEVEAMRRDLRRAGHSVPLPPATLRRAERYYRRRAYRRAARMLKSFKGSRHWNGDAAFLETQVLRRLGRRSEEARALETMAADADHPRRPDALLRMGQISMGQDQNDEAIGWFDRLAEAHPMHKLTPEGQYLAGWVLYDEGRYQTATERLLDFAMRYPRADNRDDALWFAAWSAYLDGAYPRARRALRQLLHEHPRSSLRPQSLYWLGRIAGKEGKADVAQRFFEETFETAPLSYYGSWASIRLRQAGGADRLFPPASPPPESPKALLRAMGPRRPILVDRALALAGRRCHAIVRTELRGAAEAMRRQRDLHGRALMTQLLEQLGAHDMSFRQAARLTTEPGQLRSGRPAAWAAWRTAYPRAFERPVQRAAKKHEIPPSLIWAVMRTESRFRPGARSPAGARGLMQLMPGTARQIGRNAKGGRRHARRFRRPDSNIWLGTWYLGRLLAKFDHQLPAAIGAYNAGPRAMARWLGANGGRDLDEFVERVTYRETRRYIRRVLETYFVYERLYEGALPTLPPRIRDARRASIVNF